MSNRIQRWIMNRLGIQDIINENRSTAESALRAIASREYLVIQAGDNNIIEGAEFNVAEDKCGLFVVGTHLTIRNSIFNHGKCE
jgi:hypothetical protein